MEVVDKGGDKFHISPDPRKGSISLFKGPDDQLMHFAWKERPSGSVVDVSPPRIFVSVFAVFRERGFNCCKIPCIRYERGEGLEV